MMETSFTVLLWITAIGCGMMAGIYFAFSSFIMAAFSRITPEQGIAAMQSINATIVRSAFMPLFFGTVISSLVLTGLVLFNWQNSSWHDSAALPSMMASIIYLVGMFICTIIFNVPLNNALQNITFSGKASQSVEARSQWADYLKKWTAWNHVRTLASTSACLFFIYAIRVS